MEVTITVRGCDTCKRTDRPTTRYTLQSERGQAVTRDLCAEDAAPLEDVFGPLVPAEEPSPQDAVKEQLLTLMGEHEEDTRARRARAEAEVREAKSAPARKTTQAKKTTAKKTTRRRGGTPVMTLEEIEAKKAAAAKS
ncbi:hypothetical protein AB0A60_25580 [Streptomyces sp. NPDC046275]|uniref:hypothetical protein n=1 Tax=Streptomyces sp. NPDC046275 TaxID=3157201 RepID=UPI0033C13DBE